MDKNTSNSLFREKICELGFLTELYKFCWQKNVMQLDTLKPDIDHSGYDLVVVINNKVNFVQLKSISSSASTREVKFHGSILSKESAYLILIEFNNEDESLEYYSIPINQTIMTEYSAKQQKDSDVNFTISVSKIKRAGGNKKTIEDIFKMLAS